MRCPFNRKILGALLLVVLLLGPGFTASPALAQNTKSSTLFFSIPSTQVREGQKITVEVKVGSPSESINAVSGVVSYPADLLHVVSLSKDKSIVNLWTEEPKLRSSNILFEGIILNPGFQGASGTIFQINFEAEKAGVVSLSFNEGSILANDGRGTNILATLGSANFKIAPGQIFYQNGTLAEAPTGKLAALPVITDYSPTVDPANPAFFKGKGEPNALTKIVFKDVSFKSVGEQFIEFLQTKKEKLDEVLVKNDAAGLFQYTTSKNLLAGVYNATPFLVDPNANTEKPGLGVQLLVNDSQIVKMLVVVINVLGLLIPVVGLGVIIYFIPWYSWRRMRVLKKKLGLEEEKLDITGHQLERQEKIQDAILEKPVRSVPISVEPGAQAEQLVERENNE